MEGDDQSITDDAIPTAFIDKLKTLPRDTLVRRIRPDGNCFYRAYAFGILEALRLHGQQDLPGTGTSFVNWFRELVAKDALERCEKAGYPRFTVEDFMEAFLEEMDKFGDNSGDKEVDAGNDAYIVSFLRCLASSVLKLHASEYSPFLETGYATIDQYTATEVDPMYKEADQLPIVSLSR
ncbi:OTU domain, ubiquitin aldehyde binding [Perkinsus chesapeaki]|uniref:OTU domain, ubiquitin aldehyde binding n=1 Tax=Perkinsus chesapeaki TaxID=330153 RepID=A0A7J6M5K9_PERCH|nr:OTU domain, ubiquitin aldehyde binding [Perkinsus chesapeaki]